MTKKEQKELLNDSKAFEWLSKKQLFILIWWDLFNKKRMDVFYESLKIGKHVIFAYDDAKNYGKIKH